MINGYAQRRLDQNAWEIALVDPHRNLMFTLEFKSHKREDSLPGETTMIPNVGEHLDLLKALSEALHQMGIIPGTAIDAELKATKFHLEDMRKLVFK